MNKLLLILSIVISSQTVFAASERWQKKIECKGSTPIIDILSFNAPKSKVILEKVNFDNGQRKIQFKKNKDSNSKTFIANCNMQAAYLTCVWQTGKIVINTIVVI